MTDLIRIVKPGTRCECREIHEAVDPHKEWIHGTGLCANDAVRMVTVPWGTQWTDNKFALVPMCEPCAAYHESEAGAR